MPPLPNQRHEKFCIALFEGQPQNAAYEAAGYRYHEGNASRLRSNEKVIARLAELQQAAAKSSEVTIQSLLAELEHARQRADSLDQLSAAVKATSEKAKISGLLVQRVEVGTPGDFDQCESDQDIVNAIIQNSMADGKVFSEEEQTEFRGILMGWLDAMTQFHNTHGKYAWVVEANNPAETRNRQINGAHRQRQIGNGAKK